jgi:uroporphyrin-III C-methyltransferase/precorrin-2 dehydrogenase/sirohydrochlorin ferrochelatase
MPSLAALPLFADLRQRRVVVAGAGEAAVWKAELAAAAGASVHLFARNPGAELLALRAALPAGSLEIVPRQWRAEDLDGAALAIGALRAQEARDFAAAARRHRVPVNIVDTPELSDVNFGTIVNRSPVLVAITTGGAAPVLGQAVRVKIEALLPRALGAWATAAAGLRRAIAARLPMGAARRKVWWRFARKALAASAAPHADELGRLASGSAVAEGSVALVGAGPGDPELLTLKALRTLQSADVILYAQEVSPPVLELARREARRIPVGAAARGRRDGDANALMLRLAKRGLRVVLLRGGDAKALAVHELAACRAAGIAVEVVPGITVARG